MNKNLYFVLIIALVILICITGYSLILKNFYPSPKQSINSVTPPATTSSTATSASAPSILDKDTYHVAQGESVSGKTTQQTYSIVRIAPPNMTGFSFGFDNMAGLPPGADFSNSTEPNPCGKSCVPTFTITTDPTTPLGEYFITTEIIREPIGYFQNGVPASAIPKVIATTTFTLIVEPKVFPTPPKELTLATGVTCIQQDTIPVRFQHSVVVGHLCKQITADSFRYYNRYFYTAAGTYQIAETDAGVFQVTLKPGTVVMEEADGTGKLIGFTDEYGEVCMKDFCPSTGVEVLQTNTEVKNFEEFSQLIKREDKKSADSSSCPITYTTKSMGGYEALLAEGFQYFDCGGLSYLDIFTGSQYYFKISQPTLYFDMNSLKKIE